MQVICPNCGEPVSGDHINIQQMAAVCSACGTVFKFDLPEEENRAKRRKVKQPDRLVLRDDDESLRMAFRTNFRLDRNQAFQSSAFGTAGATFMALLLLGTGKAPLLLPAAFFVVALICLYWLMLTVFNETHIDMDEYAIHVSRRPIPNILSQPYDVKLADVAAIKYEETAISKKESYDTPRYRVWAETADGARRTIVNDVVEDYAVFIAQRLEERLHAYSDVDVSRLADTGEDALSNVQIAEEIETQDGRHRAR